MTSKSITPKTGMRDDAVRKATGKTWQQWFAILDRAGARKLDHRGIVAIASKHCDSGWWRQMVTVEYERSRGLREKYETTAGFQISRSKTFAVPVARAYAACADAKRRSTWLPRAKLDVTKATPSKSIRARWTAGDTRVELMFLDKGPRKSQIAVQHNKLPDAQAAERMKRYWSDELDRLAAELAD